MSIEGSRIRFLGIVPAILWLGLIYAPLVVLLSQALASSSGAALPPDVMLLILKSAAIAAGVALVSVAAGYVPGRVLAGSGRYHDIVLLAVFLPLILPDYVLYYAWSLLLSPTTYLGSILSADQTVARMTSFVTSSMVLVLWHWPIAALLIGHAFGSMDPCVLDSAAMDAGRRRAFRHVVLPLLARPLLLAFGVCFTLVLSSFTTFHLSGARTLGTELAALYEQTFSPAVVALAAWPMLIPAILVAVAMGSGSRSLQGAGVAKGHAVLPLTTRDWTVFYLLVTLSVGVPAVLFIANITAVQPFLQFMSLHGDQLVWGFVVAFAAALMSYVTAAGLVQATSTYKSPAVSISLYAIVFLGMFMPGSLTAVSLLELSSLSFVPEWFRQSFLIVSLGHAARFTGPVLILLLLGRDTRQQRLSEMAAMEGASRVRAFVHVHLPAAWRLLLSAFILIVMFSVAEIPATMILLPAGLPSYSQMLLNQMHYARDQQVIASCLALMACFVVLAGALVVVLRGRFARMAALAAVLILFAVPGCTQRGQEDRPSVVATFGTTGKGQSQFIYPRAIDMAADGTLFVVDKAGRIQHLGADGRFISEFSTPEIESGKPTGITVGPDGNLYVADTHYHRVLVYAPDGTILREWGRRGEEPGCFIYPTDVAFSGDGRIFVSEYGGNDRISVFDEESKFLYSFGTPGDKDGQFSRPAAMAVDRKNKLLYVADACNHRIGVFDFDGKLQRNIGTAGTALGELRYPYSVVLTEKGDLVVCEYGNNRIQVFDPSGRSLGVKGRAGRQVGELAYPWAVAMGSDGRAFIVDSGNNRIQIWRI